VADPLFWLGLSLLLVAVSLTAVLVAALPALRELARAARSAEKLFDTLSRELPPTLEAIRLTGLEITDLTDDVSQGVQSASQVVQRVDQSIDSMRHQARKARNAGSSLAVGVRAAWRAFTRPEGDRPSDFAEPRPYDQLPANTSGSAHFDPYDPRGDLDEAPALSADEYPADDYSADDYSKYAEEADQPLDESWEAAINPAQTRSQRSRPSSSGSSPSGSSLDPATGDTESSNA